MGSSPGSSGVSSRKRYMPGGRRRRSSLVTAAATFGRSYRTASICPHSSQTVKRRPASCRRPHTVHSIWETKLTDGLMGLLFLRLGGGHDLLREVHRHFLVVRELHGVSAAAARHRAERGLVSEHLRH